LDFFAFWKRRFIRLYPAYIASILLYIWWVDFNWFFVWDLLSHLLMLHNFSTSTVYSMNGVWWTLAIEEQLYLLYFVLLWMRRKWGWNLTLLVTLFCRFLILGLSIGLHAVGFDMPFNESALSNWWIWALGAVAVEAHKNVIKLPEIFYSKLLTAIVLVVTATFYYFGATQPGTIYSRLSAGFTPLLWGFGFFLLINWVVRENYSVRLLAFIGLFSYSLYLTHEFVIKILNPNILIGTVACLIFGYAFFRVFERPFMKPAI